MAKLKQWRDLHSSFLDWIANNNHTPYEQRKLMMDYVETGKYPEVFLTQWRNAIWEDTHGN